MSNTRLVGVTGNGSPLNTLRPEPRPLVRSQSTKSTSLNLHGLEDDPDLYLRVMQRIREPGDTVPFEDVLRQIDARSTRQS